MRGPEPRLRSRKSISARVLLCLFTQPQEPWSLRGDAHSDSNTTFPAQPPLCYVWLLMSGPNACESGTTRILQRGPPADLQGRIVGPALNRVLPLTLPASRPHW